MLCRKNGRIGWFIEVNKYINSRNNNEMEIRHPTPTKGVCCESAIEMYFLIDGN